MIEISKISKYYTVRILSDSDMDKIFDLCQKNPLFYEYTEARPTKEQILDDMKMTPPSIELSDKYYCGFFEKDELTAIIDLANYQGNHIGSSIIHEVIEYLRSIGKTAIRLAIDKGNPQSTHFWKKNGFEILFEVDVNGWAKLVAEKSLQIE